MKKTTMQEIADSLGVSRVSVWKVFNGHPGVSSALRQRVFLKSEELGYPIHSTLRQEIMPGDFSAPAAHLPLRKKNDGTLKATATFSVVISRPESSVFWANIIHVIARELNKTGINLMYTYVPSQGDQSFLLPDALTDGSVQGIIVLNVYDLKILTALNALPLPKVFLDAVPALPLLKLEGDLVLLAGESQVYEITSHLIDKGLGKIGFIGDIDYALTNLYRYTGYTRAMQEAGLMVAPEICMTANIGIETYEEEIHAFLRGLEEMPEAFVCVSDYVAYFALQYFNEHHIRVPEDILLSGFDGISDYTGKNDSLTTVPIAFEPLGRRLVRQLRYRIAHPDYPYEIIYIQSPAVYRSSTKDAPTDL